MSGDLNLDLLVVAEDIVSHFGQDHPDFLGSQSIIWAAGRCWAKPLEAYPPVAFIFDGVRHFERDTAVMLSPCRFVFLGLCRRPRHPLQPLEDGVHGLEEPDQLVGRSRFARAPASYPLDEMMERVQLWPISEIPDECIG